MFSQVGHPWFTTLARLPAVFLVLAVWIFCAVVASSQSTSAPNDLTLEGLKGKVKRIDEETATVVIKNGVSVEIDRHQTRSIVFDGRGRITYQWERIVDLPPFEHKYNYDKQGNQYRRTSQPLLSGQAESGRDEPSQVSMKTYRFDPTSRILVVYEYRGDKIDEKSLRQIYEYYFDESGTLTHKVTRDSKNREVFRRTYVYDPQSVISEERLSMAENPVGQILGHENTVDSTGNWTKRISQNTILKSGVKKTEVVYRKISYRR